MGSVVIEITNGVVIVITGLILYGVRGIFTWVKSIDDRLNRLERQIGNKD